MSKFISPLYSKTKRHYRFEMCCSCSKVRHSKMWVRPENVPQSSIAKIWTKNTAMPHAQKNKSIDVINVYKRFLKRLKNKKAFLTF